MLGDVYASVSSHPVKRTIQRRLLLGALVCAVLLIVCYLGIVRTSWGHQLDDDAYFGREALNRKVIKLDSVMLDLVTKAALLLAAVVVLLIATLRRCTFVGVVALMGLGCAIVGAEVLKDTLPWRALVPDDGLFERGFQTGTYPSGHATIGTALAGALEYPHGDLPFFAITGLITAGAFSLSAWYGWQLRAVDWPADRVQ
jgi:membrane-associated phospholipid phosphatase